MTIQRYSHAILLVACSLLVSPEIHGQATDGFRTWTGATGKHKIKAKLVATKKGWVQLQTRDGKKISLPIEKLSKADQDFLKR